jgi:hypothetical protein
VVGSAAALGGAVSAEATSALGACGSSAAFALSATQHSKAITGRKLRMRAPELSFFEVNLAVDPSQSHPANGGSAEKIRTLGHSKVPVQEWHFAGVL